MNSRNTIDDQIRNPLFAIATTLWCGRFREKNNQIIFNSKRILKVLEYWENPEIKRLTEQIIYLVKECTDTENCSMVEPQVNSCVEKIAETLDAANSE